MDEPLYFGLVEKQKPEDNNKCLRFKLIPDGNFKVLVLQVLCGLGFLGIVLGVHSIIYLLHYICKVLDC